MAALRRRQPLLPPDLHLPLRDTVDYVAGFQDLARLGLEMHRSGPTLPLLLRKATLELRVGSYWAACFAASDAVVCDATCADAHWLLALGMLGLCLVDLGLLTEGPGEPRPGRDMPVAQRLLAVQRSLLECVRLSGGQDQEAATLLAYLETVLQARPPRSRLPALLRCLA
ncbi:MAG TPA: hypothetical protein VM241_08355 [Candidatus Thermoplasmatota archaeon]|nr:hypothetical protein [Candidatus Thermoplasmatota archaeon]